MAMLGVTGFNGRGSPFLPLSQNELHSPLTHLLIHSFTGKSIIFTFTHSFKKKKKTPKQNQNLQVGCQSHMLGANPEFLDLGLKPGQQRGHTA